MATPIEPPAGGQAEKFVLKSRAFWAMAAPVVSVFLTQTGANAELFGAADAFVTTALAAVGAGAWLWHHLQPDFARVRGVFAKKPAGGL